MPMPRKPTGKMTPERQKIRDMASLLCDRRAAKTAWHDRKQSSRMCDFPKHPGQMGRKFCRTCRSWLTMRMWETESSIKDGQCDYCCRDGWRRYNLASRHKGKLIRTDIPMGWGFW